MNIIYQLHSIISLKSQQTDPLGIYEYIYSFFYKQLNRPITGFIVAIVCYYCETYVAI